MVRPPMLDTGSDADSVDGQSQSWHVQLVAELSSSHLIESRNKDFSLALWTGKSRMVVMTLFESSSIIQ
jgi:hypothetical protein